MREVTQEEVDSYRWYHHFKFPGGAETKPAVDCADVWDFVKPFVLRHDFTGKRVLDCGARDCFWALMAEVAGASEITAIDISLNPGVKDIVLPCFGSKIDYVQRNVMEVTGCFDTILCLGILYHLRYPFMALKRLVDCLAYRGTIIVETAILVDIRDDMPLLYCPVEDSPYESTSCTFFNLVGLIKTAASFGLECMSTARMFRTRNNPPNIDRSVFVFTKTGKKDRFLEKYWNGVASVEELSALRKA